MVTSPATIEYLDGEQWGVVSGVYQAPNHEYVGTWAQSKDITGENGVGWVLRNSYGQGEFLKSQAKAYADFRAPVLGVYRADNQRYTGEFRASFLNDAVLKVTLTDSRGIKYLDTTFSYVADYGKIRLGGVYADKYSNLNVSETWGNKKWDVEGSFTHYQTKYLIKGERLYTRGRADLIDTRTGKVAGYLIYGYNPTRAQMKAFRSGSSEPADAVVANFVVPGSPTIQIKTLRR